MDVAIFVAHRPRRVGETQTFRQRGRDDEHAMGAVEWNGSFSGLSAGARECGEGQTEAKDAAHR